MLRRSALAALLAAAPAAAPGSQARLGWWDRAIEGRAGHYWIKTDLEPADAQRIAAHLELVHQEYARRLAGLPPRAPAALNVLLFERREDYMDVLQQRFGVDPAGTGGMFFDTPSGSALALFTEGLPRRRVLHVLQHEGFHQFGYSRFGADLPPWLNEGLAELFGHAVVVDRGLAPGLVNPRVLRSVQEAIELGTYVPFERMLAMGPRAWSEALRTDRAGALYHQAWSMVHFLVYGDSGRYVTRFEAYLRMVNAGFPSPHAFRTAFETDDVESFEKRWKEHVLAAVPSAYATALERIEFLAEGALELGRRGASSPRTLDELGAALRAIGFACDLRTHAAGAVLRSDDPEMYRIPRDGLCREQPVFVVAPAKPAPAGVTMPPSISTEHLEPRDLAVRWLRHPETGGFGYEVE